MLDGDWGLRIMRSTWACVVLQGTLFYAGKHLFAPTTQADLLINGVVGRLSQTTMKLLSYLPGF